MTKTRTLAALIAAIVLAAAGAAGGYAWANNKSTDQGSASTIGAVASQASATGHNDEDVMFAQTMVPHHAQALEMAKLAATRASSPQVKALALTIQAAQQPEIDTMKGWLKSWNATSMGAMSHDMGGMMSDSNMASLASTNGAEFDKKFLTMMMNHHDGAIDMATSELESGENADALALATSIYVTQQAQVKQMQGLSQ